MCSKACIVHLEIIGLLGFNGTFSMQIAAILCNLETDVYVWCYTLLPVHARNEWSRACSWRVL